MKKSLFSLALIASSLLAVQAATVQIDFGRSDATTEGALNMNYDNASASLGSMPREAGIWFSFVMPAANAVTPIQNQEKGVSRIREVPAHKERYRHRKPSQMAADHA